MPRPLYRCSRCGYEWRPRGRDRSRRCPNCGVVFTEARDQAGGCARFFGNLACGVFIGLVLLAGAVVGLVLIFAGRK